MHLGQESGRAGRSVPLTDRTEQLTRFERFLKLLDARAHDQPVIAKALLALYVAADRENTATGVKVLAAAIDYKEKHEAAFARATMAKRRPPPIYPHPDDVIIHSNGTVHIDGPVTAQGARELEKVILYRDLLILVAEEALDCPESARSVEQTRKLWSSYRRKFYRVHRRIPQRLYKPFPAFRAAPSEETDEY